MLQDNTTGTLELNEALFYPLAYNIAHNKNFSLATPEVYKELLRSMQFMFKTLLKMAA